MKKRITKRAANAAYKKSLEFYEEPDGTLWRARVAGVALGVTWIAYTREKTKRRRK